MKISKKMAITFALGMLILLMPNVSAADPPAIPEEYSQSAPIGKVQIYNILSTNGQAQFMFYDSNWTLISSTSVGFEVGGKIEMVILEFIEGIPYIDLAVYRKDGTVNSSFSNISMNDMAFQFILNVGSFVPGFLCKNNWTAAVDQLTAIANQPAGDPYSMNGTFTYQNESDSITFDYKQNPDNGNQNTTITFDKETGILLNADLAFGNYFLAFEKDYQFPLEQEPEQKEPEQKEPEQKEPEQNAFEIPGYPIAITLAVSAMTTIVFMVLKSKRRQQLE